MSAGFAPIAIGTEVDGSLVQPAARAALYALKPTIGSTELGGIFAVSEDFDAVGGMAKCTLDLALLTEMILNPTARAKIPKDGYQSFLKKDFKGLSIGFVDPRYWQWPDNIQRQNGNSLQELVSSPPPPSPPLISRLSGRARTDLHLEGWVRKSDEVSRGTWGRGHLSYLAAFDVGSDDGWGTGDNHLNQYVQSHTSKLKSYC